MFIISNARIKRAFCNIFKNIERKEYKRKFDEY